MINHTTKEHTMSIVKTIATPKDIDASGLPAVQITDTFIVVPDAETGLVDLWADQRPEEPVPGSAPDWGLDEEGMSIDSAVTRVAASVMIDESELRTAITALTANA